jgi:hypothetical protein
MDFDTSSILANNRDGVDEKNGERSEIQYDYQTSPNIPGWGISIEYSLGRPHRGSSNPYCTIPTVAAAAGKSYLGRV